MINKLFDNLISNAIVLIVYVITLLLWNFNFDFESLLSYVFFPFGIIILGYLFFGNKIIYAFISGHIIYFFICNSYNLNLYLPNYLFSSISYIICVPVTLFMFKVLNFTVGVGNIYILDKTNIYHVLLITLFVSVIFFILVISFGLFNKTSILSVNFILGNLIGGSLLIILLKILVIISNFFRKLFRFYIRF